MKEYFKKSREKFAEDEFIGGITKKNGRIKFKLRKDFKNLFVPASLYRKYLKEINYNGVIAFIVESPHVHEFKIEIPKFPEGESLSRPLNNPSTRKFIKGIFENGINDFFLNKIEEGEIYLVLVVNSIQFQCSLGKNTNVYRDKLWISNWLYDREKQFIDRIKFYNPTYFVNCCTKGSSERGKKEYIDEFFLEENFKMKLLELNNTEKNKDIKFKLQGREWKKNNLTLQDIVEYSLEKENFINNKNYLKYNHPSYFVYRELDGNVTYPSYKGLSNNKILVYSKQ